MGMSGTMQAKIIAAVAGLILIGLWTQLYEVQNAAADQFYLTTQPKCEISGEPFTKLYPPVTEGGSGFFLTQGMVFTETQCKTAVVVASPSEAAVLYTEHNQAINTGILTAQKTKVTADSTWGSVTFATLFGASAGLGGTWEPVLPIIAQYGVITRQVIAIIPVVGIAIVVSISAGSLFAFGVGVGAHDLAEMVITQIVTLVVYVVGLVFAPEVMGFMNTIFMIFFYERFSINDLYNVILQLIMGFAPIIYAAGLVGSGPATLFVKRRIEGRMGG